MSPRAAMLRWMEIRKQQSAALALRLPAISLLLLCGATAAWAESAYLVRDLAPGINESAEVAPGILSPLGDRVFFFGEAAPFSGYHALWVSDGTAGGTRPLVTVSVCYGIGCPPIVGTAGPLVYFFAVESLPDSLFWVLWRSDGTRAGTFRLHEAGPIHDGEAYVAPQYALLGNVLYFRGCPERWCDQLWRTDGTLAGTTQVADLTPPKAVQLSAALYSMRALRDKLYFLSPLPGDGQTVLWRSDGTSAGTSPFAQLDGELPSTLRVAGSHLFFVAEAPITGGDQLWVADGTADPSPVMSFASIVYFWMKVLGDRVYFLADDGTHGQQLWVSDGTGAGTAAVTGFTNRHALDYLGDSTGLLELLGDQLLFVAGDFTRPPDLWSIRGPSQPPIQLCSGNCGSILPPLVKVGARMVFLTRTSSNGFDLWGTDGTAAGTRRLAKACGSACSVPPDLQPAGGKAFFPVEDSSGKRVLWQSDGTAAGTLPFAGGLATGQARATTDSLQVAAFGDKLLFTGLDGGGGVELWVSDGTAAGTRQLTDVNVNYSSVPSGFVPLGNLVFFSANTPYHNLWQSAGTAGTTARVPGADGLDGPLVAAGGSVFFPRSGQLWHADGSAADARQLTNLTIGQTLGPMVALQGQLFFLVSAPNAVSLWMSDGTPQGTTSAVQLPSSPNLLLPASLSAAGGLLFYTTFDLVGPGHAWRSDGTAQGTFELARTVGPQPTAAGSWIYFSATRDGQSSELWRTDGTVAGTAPVTAGSQVIAGPQLTLLTEASGILFFTVHSSDGSAMLWRSDGSPGGSFPLGKLYPAHAAPSAAVLGNQLLIALDDGVHGLALWASDGSVAGTRLVREFHPAATGSIAPSIQGLVAAGGRVFFSADDGVHGFELWESDGTTAGTRLAQDISPGPSGSYPGGMTQAGDLLYFDADDGLTGAELWALPLTGSTLCRPGPTALCLQGDRFKVEAYWRDFQGNSGAGQAVRLTPDTGYFWFFGPDNVEVIGKVIDGRQLNGNFWFFYGALSSVEYSLTVTDTVTGAARRYLNPAGQLASAGDTSAFGPQGTSAVTDPAAGRAGAAAAAAPATGAAAGRMGTELGRPGASAGRAGQGATPPDGTCSPGATTLCLGGQRFSVTVSWQDFSGRTGSGTAVDLTADTGYFWFFNQDNVELVLKVLDGRAVNGKFWVFYGALSNVAYTITVQDTVTNQVRTYTNPSGQFASAADTGAF